MNKWYKDILFLFLLLNLLMSAIILYKLQVTQQDVTHITTTVLSEEVELRIKKLERVLDFHATFPEREFDAVQ